MLVLRTLEVLASVVFLSLLVTQVIVPLFKGTPLFPMLSVKRHSVDAELADNISDSSAKGRHPEKRRTSCPLGHAYDMVDAIGYRSW